MLYHSRGKPCVTAVRQEKHYQTKRGTAKTVVTERERIPLTDVQVEDGAVVFSRGEYMLRMAYEEFPDGTEFFFAGEGGWSYKFAPYFSRI